MYLASSRSGAPKRVCDTCYTRDHGGAPKQRGGTGDASGAGGDEEDLGRRVSKVAVSSPDDEPEEEDPKAGAAAAAAEASIAALKEFPFEGKWMALMSFHVVEMGPKTQVDGEFFTGRREGGLRLSDCHRLPFPLPRSLSPFLHTLTSPPHLFPPRCSGCLARLLQAAYFSSPR